MILRARTLPTPGSDSSTAETFILPTTSLLSALLEHLAQRRTGVLSRFFTAARSRRAIAAFSRAAARCSGVSGGRATQVTSA